MALLRVFGILENCSSGCCLPCVFYGRVGLCFSKWCSQEEARIIRKQLVQVVLSNVELSNTFLDISLKEGDMKRYKRCHFVITLSNAQSKYLTALWWAHRNKLTLNAFIAGGIRCRKLPVLAGVYTPWLPSSFDCCFDGLWCSSHSHSWVQLMFQSGMSESLSTPSHYASLTCCPLLNRFKHFSSHNSKLQPSVKIIFWLMVVLTLSGEQGIVAV